MASFRMDLWGRETTGSPRCSHQRGCRIPLTEDGRGGSIFPVLKKGKAWRTLQGGKEKASMRPKTKLATELGRRPESLWGCVLKVTPTPGFWESGIREPRLVGSQVWGIPKPKRQPSSGGSSCQPSQDGLAQLGIWVQLGQLTHLIRLT